MGHSWRADTKSQGEVKTERWADAKEEEKQLEEVKRTDKKK